MPKKHVFELTDYELRLLRRKTFMILLCADHVKWKVTLKGQEKRAMQRIHDRLNVMAPIEQDNFIERRSPCQFTHARSAGRRVLSAVRADA